MTAVVDSPATRVTAPGVVSPGVASPVPTPRVQARDAQGIGNGADVGRAPSYPVAAIDNTLRTLKLLGTVGQVGVVDVANHLHVARSTAHRLLTMLTYHGFAEQEPKSRKYRLQDRSANETNFGRRVLVSHARPVLARAAAATGHTAHLAVLEGDGARFLYGVMAPRPPRRDSRGGVLYPAHLTAAGRALLAELPVEALQALYPSRIGGHGMPAIDYRSIGGVLHHVRRRGYAINEGENELGVNAVALPVRDATGVTVAAITVAGSAATLQRSDFAGVAARLQHYAQELEASLQHGV